MRLISEREAEIEAFQPQEYWSIAADLKGPGGLVVNAAVVEVSYRSDA